MTGKRKLKPCPFCGCEKIVLGSEIAEDGKSLWSHMCSECGASGPPIKLIEYEGEDVNASQILDDKWQHRESELENKIESLKALNDALRNDYVATDTRYMFELRKHEEWRARARQLEEENKELKKALELIIEDLKDNSYVDSINAEEYRMDFIRQARAEAGNYKE